MSRKHFARCAFALVATAAMLGAAPAPNRPVQQHAAPHAAEFSWQENDSGMVLKTHSYEAEITRQGFGLTLRRGTEVVLQTAQPGDAEANLSVQDGNTLRAPGKLLSSHRTRNGVVLDYALAGTGGATVEVELRPAMASLHLTAAVFSGGNDLTPTLRFRLAPSGDWYGGAFQGFRSPQVFPLNQAHIVKNGFLAEGNTQGTPIWYSTKGVAVWIHTPHDFAYSVNRKVHGADDGMLSVTMPGVSSVQAELLVEPNIHDVVRTIIRRIGYPRTTPPADYLRLPVYTTWVEYKTAVNQQRVLEYAHAIHDHNLPCGVIEIDDKWESNYGDTQFDRSKFPDPKAMVDELHRMGYRVTLWVHPFVNTGSRTYAEHRRDGILLRGLNGEAGKILWWNGVAAVWDFTNPRAAAMFRSRLHRLQKLYGFDGFKFDGGDVPLIPRDMQPYKRISATEYPDVYNREATAHFAWNEARVGIYSQPLGIVQRLIDKQSVWGNANGLGSVIPEAITVSMRGFPYVMPDMVGGNQYNGDKIDKEMLIRSAQESVLMPLVQFSFGPWHFDDETVDLVRQACALRARFAPLILQLAAAAPKTGEPILDPLWYIAPTDSQTFTIMDEYTIGSDVVVAPVLRKGATTRDIYLPAGTWRPVTATKGHPGPAIKGGQWLRNYPAPLNVLPVFVRDGSRAATL